MGNLATVDYDTRLLEREWGNLDNFTQEKAIDLAQKINNVHVRINRSKMLAEQAKQIKGFFKQKQINEKLANAQILANESMVDLADLIQESIKYTCSSFAIATKMHKALTYITVCGLRDVNGRVEMLNEQCAESLNSIIEVTENFVQEQKRIKDLEGKKIQKPSYEPPTKPKHTQPEMPYIHRPLYSKIRFVFTVIFTALTIDCFAEIPKTGLDVSLVVTVVIAVLIGSPVYRDIICLVKIDFSKLAYNAEVKRQKKEIQKYEKELAEYEAKYDRQISEYNKKYGIG